MANYDPATARIIVLLSRRSVRPAILPETQANGGYVYDLLPYYKIYYDVDTPGEKRAVYEMWSDSMWTTWAGSTRDYATRPPIAGFEIVEQQPNSDVFKVMPIVSQT